MRRAWTQLNLEGQGLQSLNLELTRRLRHTGTARLLWFGFPLGLHAFYLHKAGQGVAYLAATLAWIGALLTLAPSIAIGTGVLYLIVALIDVFTLESRVVAINKALRLKLSLASARKPPPGFRGRYGEDDTELADYLRVKDSEQAGHSTKPAASMRTQSRSFREQEAALKELMARRKGPKNPRS